ncbi:MAG: hypothetical protein ACK4HV_06520 [Parachlamydiaceae bacterium]
MQVDANTQPTFNSSIEGKSSLFRTHKESVALKACGVALIALGVIALGVATHFALFASIFVIGAVAAKSPTAALIGMVSLAGTTSLLFIGLKVINQANKILF